MTKTYKHNTLGVELRYEMFMRRGEFPYQHKMERVSLPTYIVENSKDRILQEEKDWIEETINTYGESPDNDDWNVHMVELRQAIESHMPKITEEELDKLRIREDSQKIDIINFLKEKGLYK